MHQVLQLMSKIMYCIIKTTNLEEGKIDNFWKLDLLRIQEKELSVSEKVMKDTKFENNRYVVKLPFKESIPFVSDNYNVSLNCAN